MQSNVSEKFLKNIIEYAKYGMASATLIEQIFNTLFEDTSNNNEGVKLETAILKVMKNLENDAKNKDNNYEEILQDIEDCKFILATFN